MGILGGNLGLVLDISARHRFSMPALDPSGGAYVFGDDSDTDNYGLLRILHTTDLSGPTLTNSGIVRASMHSIGYADRALSAAYTGMWLGGDFTCAVKRTTTDDFTTGAVAGLWGAGVWDANASCDNLYGVVGELWVYPADDGPGSEKVTTGVFFLATGDAQIQADRVDSLYGCYVPGLNSGAVNNVGILAGAMGESTPGTGRNLSAWLQGDVEITKRLFAGASTAPANANMTYGVTIDQLTADDQAFVIRSTGDIAHGMTSITGQATGTSDYFSINKLAGDTGGVWMRAMAESTLGIGMYFNSWAGAPDTTDASSSLAALCFFAGQHNGSNADVDMAANSNCVAFGEIDSNGAALTRMLLKADDGELHLGNTTLVALDDDDDVMLVRAMQKTGSSEGIIETPLDNPFYDYDKLHAAGLAGEKDAEGFFLFPLQPRLHALEGAIWQMFNDMLNIAAALPAEAQERLNPRNKARLAMLAGGSN